MKNIFGIFVILISCQLRAQVAGLDTAIWTTRPLQAGTLFMNGGGPQTTFISDELARLTGSLTCRVLVITTATDNPTNLGKLSFFTSAGFTNAKIHHTRDRDTANSQEFAAEIDSAQLIWFSGGNPVFISDAYHNTRTHTALQNFLARGGVIAGQSAGAMIQGQWDWLYMTNPSLIPLLPGQTFLDKPMLNFAPGIVLKPHETQSRTPAGNLFISVVENYQNLLGFGLPETKGIIIKDSISRAYGDYIAVYDSTTIRTENYQNRCLLLYHGETYNNVTRKQVNFRPVASIGIIDTILNPGENFAFDFAGYFHDPNPTDALIYSIRTQTRVPMPNWLTINRNSGQVTGLTPQSGVASFIIAAADSIGANNAIQLKITTATPNGLMNKQTESVGCYYDSFSGSTVNLMGKDISRREKIV